MAFKDGANEVNALSKCLICYFSVSRRSFRHFFFAVCGPKRFASPEIENENNGSKKKRRGDNEPDLDRKRQRRNSDFTAAPGKRFTDRENQGDIRTCQTYYTIEAPRLFSPFCFRPQVKSERYYSAPSLAV